MIDFTGRVAIVTGAGGGLGREHALMLAKRGAKVVVNDLGGSVNGIGQSSVAAMNVVSEIQAFGGEAIANSASVTDLPAIENLVAEVIDRFGQIDILVNNAGFLRDKSFAKMTIDDFRSVVDVHLMGAVNCCKAVWDHMIARNYGRIVLTTSSSGLFGNFGQANYGAAKMALVGLMQTLSIEGSRHNIRVNCLAPTAGTRMLEGLVPDDVLAAFTPASVSPGLLALVAEDGPNRAILCAGAGSFEQAHITLTQGIHLSAEERTAEAVASAWTAIEDRTGAIVPESGSSQGAIEIAKASH